MIGDKMAYQQSTALVAIIIVLYGRYISSRCMRSVIKLEKRCWDWRLCDCKYIGVYGYEEDVWGRGETVM